MASSFSLHSTKKMDNQITIKEYPNGIRHIHRKVQNTKIVHCAIMFDIGGRDEKENETGLAHMWEHMAFKGTTKRTAYQILSYLDALGGELNAFTTKEKICFHASVLDVHFHKASDLLVDISFHSTFPEKELEKEKKVILEEISMYLDSADDAIQDDFEGLIFPNHPMGKNLLGTAETILSFSPQHFFDFINLKMATNRIVFASVGTMDATKAMEVVRKKLQAIPKKEIPLHRSAVLAPKPARNTVEKPIQQAHFMIGNHAPSIHHRDKYSLMLLNNILGGPASNSILYLALREKYGYVYSLESNYNAFTDTGVVQIYFATEKRQIEKCLSVIEKEMRKVDNLLTKKAKLEAYKEQIKGQLAMSEENNQAYALMMARSLLDLGQVEDIETIFREVDQTTAEKLIDLRRLYFDLEKMTSLSFVPN
jgi:predicted Zn-dependent peptidase